jgi:hypothetical protein
MVSTVRLLGNERELLTGDRVYYVRADGSDSNSGLANTAGGAWLTLTYAWSFVASTLEQNGHKVTINVGTGTYDGLTATAKATGEIWLVGNPTTPTNVIVRTNGVGGFIAFYYEAQPCYIYMDGFTVLFHANNRGGVSMLGSYYVDVYDMVFDNSGSRTGCYALINQTGGGYMNYEGDCTFINGAGGNFTNAVIGEEFSKVEFVPDALTFTGAINFTNAYAFVGPYCQMYCYDYGRSGATPTGKRFILEGFSFLESYGQALPGDVAGTADQTSAWLGTSQFLWTIAADGGLSIPASIKSSHATQGIGYATGAGGAATQGTSKSTTVAFDKACGQITMHAANLNDVTTVSFTFTNAAIGTTDCVVVNHDSVGTLGGYQVWAHTIGAGSCVISVRNISGGALAEAIVLNFAVIKAVAS